MPHDEPVVVWRLVEERRTEWHRGRAQESTCECNQARVAGDLLDNRMVHQVPSASTAPLDSLLERGGDIRDVVLIQDGRHNLEAAGDVTWRFDQGCTRLAIDRRSRHELFTVYRCFALNSREKPAFRALTPCGVGAILSFVSSVRH